MQLSAKTLLELNDSSVRTKGTDSPLSHEEADRRTRVELKELPKRSFVTLSVCRLPYTRVFI